MKRHLKFDIIDNSYVISEGETIVFKIPFQDLSFNSKLFYSGLYSEGKTANVVLENAIPLGTNAKYDYIFKWLNKIICDIRKELHEDDDTGEESSNIVNQPLMKSVVLFDMAVCAGNGVLVDDQSVSDDAERVETTNEDADFAVRISGRSMEPTLKDGSVVYVKRVDEAEDGQIVVVTVDGETMVKRYRIEDKRAIFVPDNDSGEFKEVPVDGDKEIRVHGVVLL